MQAQSHESGAYNVQPFWIAQQSGSLPGNSAGSAFDLSDDAEAGRAAKESSTNLKP
jgi:hypothetical protein